MSKISILKEFWDFIRIRKKYWLVPFIIIIALLSVLIMLSQTSSVAPFVYTLF